MPFVVFDPMFAQSVPRDVARIIFGNRVLIVQGGSRILDMINFE